MSGRDKAPDKGHGKGGAKRLLYRVLGIEAKKKVVREGLKEVEPNGTTAEIKAWEPPTVTKNYDPNHVSAANSDFPVMPYTGPHLDSKSSPYPGTNIERTTVPITQIPWSTPYKQYKPIEHTNPDHVGPNRRPYAQSENVQEVIDTQQLGGIKSFYAIQHGGRESRPQNPMGRTGLSGRGTLGHWGSNPAVDALLIRQNPKDATIPEIFLIWRRADSVLATPGGMQEGDELTNALKKEVKEEVGDDIAKLLPGKPKTIVYRGYVDVSRNTDNAWIETTAFALFFNQEEARRMPAKLTPTDIEEVDAAKGGWFPLEPYLNPDTSDGEPLPLYGSHAQIVQLLKNVSSFQQWLSGEKGKLST